MGLNLLMEALFLLLALIPGLVLALPLNAMKGVVGQRFLLSLQS
jgi:hypothetical protein